MPFPKRKQDPENQLPLPSPWGTYGTQESLALTLLIGPGGQWGRGCGTDTWEGRLPSTLMVLLRGRGLPVSAESARPVCFLPTGLRCIASI